jgi:hypothetical protein
MNKVGERVRFIYSSDPYTKLEKGDEGIITGEDSLGTVHIKWDNGSTLGMIQSEGDCFEIIGD